MRETEIKTAEKIQLYNEKRKKRLESFQPESTAFLT